MRQSTHLEGRRSQSAPLLVMRVLCAFGNKISFPLYFKILGGSAHNLAKVEVASSSLVSRSKVSQSGASTFTKSRPQGPLAILEVDLWGTRACMRYRETAEGR